MRIAIDDANVQAAVDDSVEMDAATGNSVENDSRIHGDVARAVDAMMDEVHHDDVYDEGEGGMVDLDGDGIPDLDVDGTFLHNPDDEDAMIEAAKRAGEQAAEAELAAAADAAADAAAEAAEADAAAAAEALIDAVASEEVANARAEAAEAVERLARLQADWENYRKRTAAERLAERERAAENLVVALLPVLDDMERAASHATEDEACTEGSAFAQFVAGIDAVHEKMLGILEREGVSVIDPAGEAFDPLEAQAVGRVEDPDTYDETVAQVYQRGYRMGGKVIRSAMVTVTYGGPRRPAEEGDANSES